MAISLETTANGLYAASELSKRLDYPGNGIRPCIATLLETSLQKGIPPNRSEAALIIASEFKRIGAEFDKALVIIQEWNWKNSPPLKSGELNKPVKNGYSGKYKYGCDNDNLQTFCVSPESCPFKIHVQGVRKGFNDMAFIDYGWQALLPSRQVLIYMVALPYLEKTRQIDQGGLIYATQQQLAEIAGISRPCIGKDLQAMAKVGLIEYKAGSPRKWENKASEIRRIFPIPKPSRKETLFFNKIEAGGNL